MGYHISPLPAENVARMRETRRDHAGNPVEEVVADASPGFPCRDTLRDAQIGDRLLLGAWSPFERANPYAELGPVFIHAEPVGGAGKLVNLPDMIVKRPLVAARAYDANQRICAAEVAPGAEMDETITSLFARADVAFIHLRNPGFGCYLCRVDRA